MHFKKNLSYTPETLYKYFRIIPLMGGISKLAKLNQDISSLMGQIMTEIEVNTLDLDVYSKVENGLKDHIYIQETEIFRNKNSSGSYKPVIMGFETEHASIWKLLNKIDGEINAMAFIKIKKYFDEINRIFANHTEREENYIVSKPFDPDFSSIKRPENWLCNKMQGKNNLIHK